MEQTPNSSFNNQEQEKSTERQLQGRFFKKFQYELGKEMQDVAVMYAKSKGFDLGLQMLSIVCSMDNGSLEELNKKIDTCIQEQDGLKKQLLAQDMTEFIVNKYNPKNKVGLAMGL